MYAVTMHGARAISSARRSTSATRLLRAHGLRHSMQRGRTWYDIAHPRLPSSVPYLHPDAVPISNLDGLLFVVDSAGEEESAQGSRDTGRAQHWQTQRYRGRDKANSGEQIEKEAEPPAARRDPLARRQAVRAHPIVETKLGRYFPSVYCSSRLVLPTSEKAPVSCAEAAAGEGGSGGLHRCRRSAQSLRRAWSQAGPD